MHTLLRFSGLWTTWDRRDNVDHSRHVHRPGRSAVVYVVIEASHQAHESQNEGGEWTKEYYLLYYLKDIAVL